MGRTRNGRSERVLERARRLLNAEILPGRPDPKGLLALTRIIFPGEDISDPRYLPWLYDENPRGRAYEFMTKHGPLVSGHGATVPLLYKIGTESVMGGLGVNAITHPDHRGKGIFMILYEEMFKLCVRDDNRFMFGFANTSSARGCLRHLDFKEIGKLPLWLLPFNLPALIRRSKTGSVWHVAAGAAGPFLRLEQALLIPRQEPAIGIEKIAEFGPEFDAFWETAKGVAANVLVRNRDYLNWRFVKMPTRRYDIFAARTDGRLSGYLVGIMTTIEGLRWGMIVDMLAGATSEGRASARHLLAAFIRHVRAEGADLAAALMFKHAPAAKALRRTGFLVCPESMLPREFPVLLRWNMPGPAPGGFFNEKSWYITLGDYDAV